MPNPKKLFWEDVVLTDFGITPGTYTNPQITVDEFGRITSVSSTVVGSGIGVEDSGTAIGGGPFTVLNFAGSNVSITNGGSGQADIVVSSTGSISALENGTTVPNGPFTAVNFVGATVSATDGGAGQLDVNVSSATQSMGFVKAQALTSTPALIANTVPTTAFIREVTVSITTPYDLGTTMFVRDGLANVLLPTPSINPQVVGSYSVVTPENATATGDPEIYLEIAGAPAAGNCIVEVIYQVP